jgi:hypothetical protein
VVCVCYGKLLNNKKKWTINTYNYSVSSPGDYAEQKSQSKKVNTSDSI